MFGAEREAILAGLPDRPPERVPMSPEEDREWEKVFGHPLSALTRFFDTDPGYQAVMARLRGLAGRYFAAETETEKSGVLPE
jgi:hypothetical protein